MSEIIIRPMMEKDIMDAADIHRRVVREGSDRDTSYAIEDLFMSFIKKSPKTCIIAEKNSKIVGFIVGCIKEWGFGVERSGWIEMIEVDPNQMGKGIGTKLGEALLYHFKDEELKEVYTSVRWDSGDLIEFFKSIGFDKSSFINLVYKYNRSIKDKR
jgi:ribosomal protein S18 acetylase RimI-like enzyme